MQRLPGSDSGQLIGGVEYPAGSEGVGRVCERCAFTGKMHWEQQEKYISTHPKTQPHNRLV